MNIRDPEVMEKLKWLFGPLKMGGNNMQLQTVEQDEEDVEMDGNVVEREKERVNFVFEFR